MQWNWLKERRVLCEYKCFVDVISMNIISCNALPCMSYLIPSVVFSNLFYKLLTILIGSN